MFCQKLEEIKEKEERLVSAAQSVAKSHYTSNTTERPTRHFHNVRESLSQFHLDTAASSLLKKSDKTQQIPIFEISEVQARDGECLVLLKRVNIDKGAELWLPRLKESIGESLKRYIGSALVDLSQQGSMTSPVEELAAKYPAQVCLIGLAYIWTKEIESSIVELKNERKAINMGSKKFGQITAKFLAALSKTRWNNSDRPVLNHHRIRLEAMITVNKIFSITNKHQKTYFNSILLFLFIF